MDVNAELEQLPPERDLNENEDGGTVGEVRLQRTMGLWTGVSIIVGGIIGNCMYITIIMFCVGLRTHKILGPKNLTKNCQVDKESRTTLACLYRTSGRFYMLQLISVDTRYFTQPGCGHALAPLLIGKDHGQLLIESALHSF